jgi:hypothetical protein
MENGLQRSGIDIYRELCTGSPDDVLMVLRVNEGLGGVLRFGAGADGYNG